MTSSEIRKYKDGIFEDPIWYNNGHMKIRRDSLEEFNGWQKERLIFEIIRLRKELEAIERSVF